MDKYALEVKLAAVEDYLSGVSGYKIVAARHHVEVSSLRVWIRSYRAHGIDGLKKKRRSVYSVEFKLTVLQRIQADELSYRQAAALFDIRRFDMIGHWKRQYDEGGVEALSQGMEREKKTMTKQSDPESEAESYDDEHRTRQQLLDELNLLRMENAYLKKLEALAQEKKQATRRKK